MNKVLTIGTATRDVFLRSPMFKAMRLSKKNKKLFPTNIVECFALGSKIEVEEIKITTGGGAVNGAVTFARQGLSTKSLIQIGKDIIGSEILEELKSEKIKPIVIRHPKLMSGYSTLLLTPDGERTVLVHRGATSDLIASRIPFNKLMAKWVYINPSNISYKTLKKIIDFLYERGANIAMDPSSHYLKMGFDKLRPLFNKMKLVKMNREEAALLTGVNYNKERDIFKKLDECVDGIAVMTEGPKGVLVSDGKYLFRAGTYKEKYVVDRTGAGDAFGSGFVSGLIQKGSSSKDAIEYAIRLASANATSVVEHIGTKTGILTSNQYKRDKRWRRLKITSQKI